MRTGPNYLFNNDRCAIGYGMRGAFLCDEPFEGAFCCQTDPNSNSTITCYKCPVGHYSLRPIKELLTEIDKHFGTYLLALDEL